jgi:hypothetical protein
MPATRFVYTKNKIYVGTSSDNKADNIFLCLKSTFIQVKGVFVINHWI